MSAPHGTEIDRSERVAKWVLALAATLFLGLPALIVTAVGLSEYAEDYCILDMKPPPEAGDPIGGPRLEGITKVSCFYEGVGRVAQRDLWPLIFAGLVLGGTAIVLLPFFLSALVPTGAGFVRMSGRHHSSPAQRPLATALRLLWRAVFLFGAVLTIMACAALFWAVRNTVQAITGWGLPLAGPYDVIPNANDKLDQATNHLLLGTYLLTMGLGCIWASRRSRQPAQEDS